MQEPILQATAKDIMLTKLHDALHDSSRSVANTDTILVGATYAFNIAMLFLLTLAATRTDVFFVFLTVLVLVNALILATFRNSWRLRGKLLARQEEIYRRSGLEEFFDASVIHEYRRRYTIWMALDVILGLMVVVVAVLLKFAGKT